LEALQEFKTQELVYDLANTKPEVEGEGGTVRAANVGNVPVLGGEGVSYAPVELEPCRLNLPHHNPRAAEFGFITDAETLTSFRRSFVEENTGRLIVNDVGPSYAALVPSDLVHFVQNLGCTPATFLAAFGSEDVGLVTPTTQVFSSHNLIR
ncbi:unnamed protein product, partial [Discosporangium mesarthrocarpum]